MATRINKTIKESNKNLWPEYPLQYGIYSLHNFVQDEYELQDLYALNIATILDKEKDTSNVEINVTLNSNIKRYYHEEINMMKCFRGILLSRHV